MGLLRSFLIYNVRNYSKIKMKYLNVAEKNDAAKGISSFLSRGHSQRREGLSVYNKIYEFEAQVFNQNVQMVMTSVSGHLLNYAYPIHMKNWKSCDPLTLFDAAISKQCSEDGKKIKQTLEREIKSCNGLIIWTDCDREGENIGFEIINVCKAVKPNITVYRAKFSEITAQSVFRALNNLEQPNKNVSDAVDVRQELDLRTGAAYTRLQTLHLGQVFPQSLANKLVSYGSCQFPTLGFVVDRYKAVENFVEEPFWKIKFVHTLQDLSVEFIWKRGHLFRKEPVQILLEKCKEEKQATIESVKSKPKSKWRPLPLDTVEMSKTVSSKLKINAKETLKIAERLYQQGFISYPRTETNIFPKELNLRPLIEQQTVDQQWGEFASRVLNNGPNPRQGKKSDQAHPPIHPTKHAPNLSGKDKTVYDFIVRHFLACCSKDAVGHETEVIATMGREQFKALGLNVLEKNYLEVYIYERWEGKQIHRYQIGETFIPTILELCEGHTSPPNMLTEADLISLMTKCGIGTDATHAEHIETIKARDYVGLHQSKYFVPSCLGMGLYEGYDEINLGISLTKPDMRANFEKDLQLICEGRKNPDEVRREHIAKYKEVYQIVQQNLQQLEIKLSYRLSEDRQNHENNTLPTGPAYSTLFKCPKCGSDMIVRVKKNGNGYFVTCCAYPKCNYVIWLPQSVTEAQVTDQICNRCGDGVKMVKLKFSPGQNPFFSGTSTEIVCLAGCDPNVLDALGIVQSGITVINNTRQRPATTNNNRNFQQPPINNTNNRNTQQTSFSNNSNSVNISNNTNFSNNSSEIQSSGYSSLRGNSSSGSQRPNSSNWITPNPALQLPDARNNRPNDSGIDFDGVVCSCSIPAILLTVRKEGANKGKQFYKCSSGTCDFFLWAPDNQENPAVSNVQSVLNCRCGNTAVERVVRKEGTNKGRKFYVCAGPVDNKCNFFMWADEQPASGQAGPSWSPANNNRRGRGRGGNTGGTKRKFNNTDNNPRKKRKCGICGEEGHIRTNCPNAR